jgi:ABC-type multidrug transport system ATPase subunit
MTGGRVELVGLVKRFGEDTAVDGISLDIPGGEFFSVPPGAARPPRSG